MFKLADYKHQESEIISPEGLQEKAWDGTETAFRPAGWVIFRPQVLADQVTRGGRPHNITAQQGQECGRWAFGLPSTL